MTAKNVLVIRFSSLGDLVLLTPVFRELKTANVGGVHLLTSLEFRDVFHGNPYIDKLILFDRRKETFTELVEKLKGTKYDIILDEHGSTRSWALCLRMRLNGDAKRVITINKQSLRRRLAIFLNRKFKKGNKMNYKPRRENYLDLVRKITSDREFKPYTEIFTNLVEERKLIERMGEASTAKPFICIAPSSRHETKEWGNEKFSELIGKLIRDYNLILSSQWREECLYFFRQFSDLYDASELTIQETAAVMKRCVLTICNDSGAGHISESVGTPAFVIFGPTVPEFGFAPFLPQSQVFQSVGLACRPCSAIGNKKCTNEVYKKCMNDIDPGDIHQAVQSFMANRS